MLCDTNIKRWTGRLGLTASRGSHIQIDIDHHYHSKIYTSGSIISGNVTIKTQKDVTFDGVEICLVGRSHVQVGLHTQRPLSSKRTFLRLGMPIVHSNIPESKRFESGSTYRIPFTFVVPHQLSMGACTHKCSSSIVKDLHLQIPPSMGTWDFNDLAPDVTQITYSLEGKVFRKTKDNKRKPLLEGSHQINVLPYRAEEAPLHVTKNCNRYRLHQTKRTRKGLVSGDLGRISATAVQPRAIKLSADGLSSSTTSLQIAIGFAPSKEGEVLPKLNSMSAKVASNTFMRLTPMEELPDFGTMGDYPLNSVIGYTETKDLLIKQDGELAWNKRRPTSLCSGTTIGSNCDDQTIARLTTEKRSYSMSSTAWTNFEPSYTTTLDLQLSLPSRATSSKKTIFLPTFHSCLISRTYTISLDLAIGPQHTVISLAIPLQIVTQELPEFGMDQLPVYSSVQAHTEQLDPPNPFLDPAQVFRQRSLPDGLPPFV